MAGLVLYGMQYFSWSYSCSLSNLLSSHPSHPQCQNDFRQKLILIKTPVSKLLLTLLLLWYSPNSLHNKLLPTFPGNPSHSKYPKLQLHQTNALFSVRRALFDTSLAIPICLPSAFHKNAPTSHTFTWIPCTPQNALSLLCLASYCLPSIVCQILPSWYSLIESPWSVLLPYFILFTPSVYLSQESIGSLRTKK